MKTFFAVVLLALVASAVASPAVLKYNRQVRAQLKERVERFASIQQAAAGAECASEINPADINKVAECLAQGTALTESFNGDDECKDDDLDDVTKATAACSAGGCLYDFGTKINKQVAALESAIQCSVNLYKTDACKEWARSSMSGLAGGFGLALSPINQFCAADPASGKNCLELFNALEAKIESSGDNKDLQCGNVASLGCCTSSLQTLFTNMANSDEADAGDGEASQEITEVIQTCGISNVPECPAVNTEFQKASTSITFTNVNSAFITNTDNQALFAFNAIQDIKAADSSLSTLTSAGVTVDGTTVTLNLVAYGGDAGVQKTALEGLKDKAIAWTKVEATEVNGVKATSEGFTSSQSAEVTSGTSTTVVGNSAGSASSVFASLSFTALVAAVAVAFQLRN